MKHTLSRTVTQSHSHTVTHTHTHKHTHTHTLHYNTVKLCSVYICRTMCSISNDIYMCLLWFTTPRHARMYATLFCAKHRLNRPEIFARYSQYLHHGFVMILTLHDRLECMRHYFVRSTAYIARCLLLFFTSNTDNRLPNHFWTSRQNVWQDVHAGIHTTFSCAKRFTFLHFQQQQYVVVDYRLPNHFWISRQKHVSVY